MCATSSLAHAAEGALSVDVVAARVAPAVFRLGMFRGDEALGNGTGFVVRADGVLATNHHVVEALSDGAVAVDSAGVRHAVLGVLADDPVHDLALVKIEGAGYPVLPFADAAQLHIADAVLLIGSTYGYDQSLAVGVISTLRDQFPKGTKFAEGSVPLGPLVQHTAQSGQGSSGSPVVNLRGEVVAVQHSGMRELNFAARVDLLRALVECANLDAAPTPLNADRQRNLLISALVFAALIAGGVLVAKGPALRQTRRASSEPRRLRAM
jgi:S1-C subfamily serine protease